MSDTLRALPCVANIYDAQKQDTSAYFFHYNYIVRVQVYRLYYFGICVYFFCCFMWWTKVKSCQIHSLFEVAEKRKFSNFPKFTFGKVGWKWYLPESYRYQVPYRTSHVMKKIIYSFQPWGYQYSTVPYGTM